MENGDWEDDALWPDSPLAILKFGLYATVGIAILGAVALVCLSLDREQPQPRTHQVSK